MPDCECLRTCRFFHNKMPNMPAVAQLLKDRLCHGDHATCARYMTAQAIGKEGIPPDLYPDDIEKAKALIAAHKAAKSPGQPDKK